MNDSNNNGDNYMKENKNCKLLMNNNFNPNINIFNKKEDKNPNLSNMDSVDNYNNNAQFKSKISPKKEKLNNKRMIDINLLESPDKKEKESFYILNDLNNNNVKQFNNKKMYLQKLKTENDDYINKSKNKNDIKFYNFI